MKVETYKIKNWEDTETGLLISENKDWILVKHIPVDYVIDGYRLYKKEFVVDRINTKKEKQIEKVLELKSIENNPPENFEFSDTVGLLEWIEKYYELFEFQDNVETELKYGKNIKIIDNDFIIDMVNPDGSVEENHDTDYELEKLRDCVRLIIASQW